jgi:hypothetical protein
MNPIIETRSLSLMPSDPERIVCYSTRVKQLADLAADWLWQLVEGAKRMAPTAIVVALRLLR